MLACLRVVGHPADGVYITADTTLQIIALIASAPALLLYCGARFNLFRSGLEASSPALKGKKLRRSDDRARGAAVVRCPQVIKR